MRDVNITHILLARGLQQSYSLVMTTNKTVTRETLTRSQVSALREESISANDLGTRSSCEAWLDSSAPVAERPCGQLIAMIINQAAAQF